MKFYFNKFFYFHSIVQKKGESTEKLKLLDENQRQVIGEFLKSVQIQQVSVEVSPLDKQAQELEDEIQKLKKLLDQKESEKNDQTILEQIGLITEQNFYIQVHLDENHQRLKFLTDLAEAISQFEHERDLKVQEINSFQKDANDLDVLYNRLQELRIRPEQQTISKFTEKKRKYISILKKLQSQKNKLQSQLEGQYAIDVLKERIADLKIF